MKYNNSYAKLDPRLYSKQLPTPLENPKAGHFNPIVASLIGWDEDSDLMDNWVAIVSGHYVPDEFEPLAMAYAGHQFGQWAGQLGDGRGLLMAQVINKQGKLTDLHLKGAGLTPYSRMGDGRAVLRSTIREYLCGHAMSSLGIRSSNALGFVTSDTNVRRETMEKGAALMRVADSHIRLGHVEWIASFAPELLGNFTKYMIETYYPHLVNSETPVADFLSEVVTRTATMIAEWQLLGFAHGVMNTDNLSITGTTIDYGPFGFLERFDPAWINNHSDYAGRYSYQNQPAIGHWNLNVWIMHFMQLSGKAVLGETSETLSREVLSECLAHYESSFMTHYQQGLCRKMGLPWDANEAINADNDTDGTHISNTVNNAVNVNNNNGNALNNEAIETINATLTLAFDFLEFIESNKLDYTNSFRSLVAIIDPNDHPYESEILQNMTNELDEEQRNIWLDWQKNYQNHIHAQINTPNSTNNAQPYLCTVVETLTTTNPVYVLRNSMAQKAIHSAEAGDLMEVDRLFKLLSQPYQVQPLATKEDVTPPSKEAKPIVISCSS